MISDNMTQENPEIHFQNPEFDPPCIKGPRPCGKDRYMVTGSGGGGEDSSRSEFG